MTVLAFDIETKLLASEVAEQYASEPKDGDAWSRPDLFGFSCGVAIDVDTGTPRYYSPEQATDMIAALREAEVTVGFNSSGFDLGVLSAYSDVEPLRSHHVGPVPPRKGGAGCTPGG